MIFHLLLFQLLIKFQFFPKLFKSLQLPFPFFNLFLSELFLLILDISKLF